MPQGAVTASAVYDWSSQIYVFGGADRDNKLVFDTTQIYDIASNTWSMGANMPGPRSQMSAACCGWGGIIYLNGGYATASIDSVQATTWAYNPFWNTFTPRAPSPQAHAGAVSGMICCRSEGAAHLLVAGGRTYPPDTILDTAWNYDDWSDAWAQLPSMPSAKNAPGWRHGGRPALGDRRRQPVQHSIHDKRRRVLQLD